MKVLGGHTCMSCYVDFYFNFEKKIKNASVGLIIIIQLGPLKGLGPCRSDG